MRCEVEVNGHVRQVAVERAGSGFVVTIGDRTWTVDAVRVDARSLSLLMSGNDGGGIASHEVALVPDRVTGHLSAHLRSTSMPVALNGWRQRSTRDDRQGGAGQVRVVAPMPGKVVRVLAGPGAAVTARQAIVVIEAMKMENELRAGRDGVVAEITVVPGQSVEAGALLAVVSPGKSA
ncbi:MAG: biotin/lipoyl-containing protein [Vicinamibacterales bacterium]